MKFEEFILCNRKIWDVCPTISIKKLKISLIFQRIICSPKMWDFCGTSLFMNEMQPIELNSNVNLIRDQYIATSSSEVYMGASIQFVLWLFDNHRNLVCDSLCQQLEPLTLKQKKSLVKQTISNANVEMPPFNFSEISVELFVQFLLTLRKPAGTRHKITTFNRHRSALKNLFVKFRCLESEYFKSEMNIYFRGLKRDVAKRTANGEISIQEGKDLFLFQLYCAICKGFLQESHKSENSFAQLYTVLSWNLICRASNTVSICLEHINWNADALIIAFAQSKNDQLGDAKFDRHIYANPTNPSICPILSLALYFILFPRRIDTDSQLFPGASQYERYRKCLSRLFQTDNGKKFLSD